jgi:hypothetical protein
MDIASRRRFLKIFHEGEDMCEDLERDGEINGNSKRDEMDHWTHNLS